MSNDSGKWSPFNLDGSSHECKNKDNSPQPQQEQKKQLPLTLEEIQTRLQRLEKAVFGST